MLSLILVLGVFRLFWYVYLLRILSVITFIIQFILIIIFKIIFSIFFIEYFIIYLFELGIVYW